MLPSDVYRLSLYNKTPAAHNKLVYTWTNQACYSLLSKHNYFSAIYN